MSLNPQEKEVLCSLVQENINTITMIGLSDFTVKGVDLKALLNKLQGADDFIEVPEPGAVRGTTAVIISSPNNKVAMIRGIRMLTGWGLKEAMDYVTNKGTTNGGYRVELNVNNSPSSLSAIQMLRREGQLGVDVWMN